MAVLLAGSPGGIPALTLNRLCASGMDAVIAAARAIGCGEADLIIVGGVESMSRAPFAMPKAETPFSRQAEDYDKTIGWRFVNPLMAARYGTASMAETAEKVAEAFDISREAQDSFELASQTKAQMAISTGQFMDEIARVAIAQRKGDGLVVDTDEHPRATTLEKLSKLTTPFAKMMR
jgi:acetyl-CoA acetyltransferase